MPSDDIYLTKEGFGKLQDELKYLKRVRRKEISKEIGEAIDRGDISESAEYDAAKEAQGLCEKRIFELENKLMRARIIEDLDIASDKVYIGATVKLKDLNSGKEVTRILLSGEEADPKVDKISISSPVGKGLLGKAEGEEVEIEIPDGVLKYKILKITR